MERITHRARLFSRETLSMDRAKQPTANSQQPTASRGFTLIELLAVTAVLALVSSVMLANNARFGGVITLQNLAYGMAVSIRQAQVYGIAVARYGSDDFSAGYGMHFDRSNTTAYVLFADAGVENGLYDSAAGELVSATSLLGGNTIEDLCVRNIDDVEECGKNSIDILFKRPEPDAYISVDDEPLEFDADGIIISGNLARRAEIKVVSPRGDRASVIVEATGQISVQ